MLECTHARARTHTQHNTAEDAWTVFRGKVYDCTAFFDYHPGGAKYMLAVRDATLNSKPKP